jgi:hypothetical protein
MVVKGVRVADEMFLCLAALAKIACAMGPARVPRFDDLKAFIPSQKVAPEYGNDV